MMKKSFNQVTISPATSSDSAAILHLSNLLDKSEAGKEEKIKRAIDAGHLWVAKNGKDIVGYILVELFGADHHQLPNSIFLADLFVLDTCRGQGIGTKLVEHALKTLYPAEYTYFSLTHDPDEKHLTDFYQAFGFEVMGKSKAGNVMMIKKR